MNKVIKVPDSWAEVSIGQFQEIHSIDKDNKNKALEIISILVNEDIEDIRSYDIKSISSISHHLSWVEKLPNENKQKDTISIDGIDYGLIKFSDMTGGEWIDMEGYLEDSITNLHKIVALFYRPILTILNDGSLILEDYDTKTASARAELFKEKLNVEDVYGVIVFFCNIANRSIATIQVYFLEETIKMKIQSSQKVKGNKELQKKQKQRSGIGMLSFIAWLKGTSPKSNRYSN